MYGAYKPVILKATGQRLGTGWLPGLPDRRDLTSKDKVIKDGVKEPKKLPESVDLREHCSPVENQGSLGSCTAHAAIGAFEHHVRKNLKIEVDGSRRFVYKATRNLMGVTGDTGAWLRSAMAALVHCGVPDEKYWPYTDQAPAFDEEPTPFVYAVADNYEALNYFCFDPVGQEVETAKVLADVKLFLSEGHAVMFGFWGFPSFDKGDIPGGIPYPAQGEKAQWGHAIVAVGYDDKKKVANTTDNETKTGALLIRNSWGTEWGDQGYGWLPYQYVLDKLALDFWSLKFVKFPRGKTSFGL